MEVKVDIDGLFKLDITMRFVYEVASI